MNKPAGGSIRAAFFDIGNVLVRFEIGEVMRAIAWAVGRHPVGVARLIWSRDLVDGVERGKISAKELFAIFKEELRYGGDFPSFVRLWCGHFRLDRKADGLLRRVARKMPVYLLSNTNRLHYEFLRDNYAFPRRARGAVLSYELGLRKPEPAIYHAALRRAGVAAAEAFFIDDLSANVAAARKLGITAFRFTDTVSLERDLSAAGIL